MTEVFYSSFNFRAPVMLSGIEAEAMCTKLACWEHECFTLTIVSSCSASGTGEYCFCHTAG